MPVEFRKLCESKPYQIRYGGLNPATDPCPNWSTSLLLAGPFGPFGAGELHPHLNGRDAPQARLRPLAASATRNPKPRYREAQSPMTAQPSHQSSSPSTPVKIALHGATGRMGRTIGRICLEDPTFQLVGAAARADDPALGHDMGILCGVPNAGVSVEADVAGALLGADVAIDFSLAPAVEGFVSAAVAAGVAIVSGTTGLDERQLAALKRASEKVPVLWARNMSLGVQVLSELVAEAVRKLGPGYDVEVVEVHHHHKVDCPSGTALRLADAARLARPELQDVASRAGQVGPRRADELGVFGLRGGDVIGDHTVHLMGLGERLELTHRATSREVFARGAVRAAAWIRGRAPGMYTIADVVR